MFEVYSRERPARPLVAIVASGLLLLGVVAAAAIVSRQRRNVVLSPPIHPGGWAVTFRAPQDWQRGVASVGDEQAIVLYDPSEPAAHRHITVARWPRPGSDDPKRIALGILYVDSPIARAPNATWENLPLGVLPGGRATLVVPGARRLPHSLVLHVGVVSARDAYSLKLDSQAPLGARDLAILNLMADSVQWAPNRSVVLNADGSSRLGTAPQPAAERQ